MLLLTVFNHFEKAVHMDTWKCNIQFYRPSPKIQMIQLSDVTMHQSPGII